MDRLIALSVLLVITLIGFLRLRSDYLTSRDELTRSQEYRDRFVKFAVALLEGQFNPGDHTWLLAGAQKMQQSVSLRIKYAYQPRYASYMVTNYELVPNTLLKIGQRGRLDSEIEQDIRTCDGVFTMLLGSLNNEVQSVKARYRSPMRWFPSGFAFILQTPARLLADFDLVSNRLIQRLFSTLLFRLLNGTLALITLFANLATVIAGWPQVRAFLHGILPGIVP